MRTFASPKLAPSSIEAEQSVLGAILLDNAALATARGILIPQDFYRTAHHVIFQAMLSMAECGEPIDNITLTEALKKKGQLADVGGAGYLAELIAVVPSAANVLQYCRIVKDKSHVRQIRAVAISLTAAIDDDGSAEALSPLLEQLHTLSSLAEQSGSPEQTSENDALPAFPEDAWRGPFADYRASLDGTSEAPDTAHFAALWATVAARLKRRVMFHYAYPHYTNVYLVNYAPTGQSKTSSGRQVLRLLPDDGRVKVLRGIGSAEALGDWMTQAEGTPPVSHLLFVEELSTLLTRGGWEGSTVLSFLTETFDCPDVYEVPFRKNPVRVEEPTPTLLAGTTPDWFWKSMREIDVHGGFGNRIFFFTGSPKSPIPLPRKPHEDSLHRVAQALNNIDAMKPAELAMEQPAVALWEEFYIAWKKTHWSELTAAAVKRIPTYIIKLAMVYAALEGTCPVIRKPQLAAAISVGHYGALCAQRLMERHQLKTRQGQLEARVLHVLETRPMPAWQVHHAISGRYSAEDVNRAIKSLVTAGTVLVLRQTKRGGAVYGLRDGGKRDEA